MRMPPDDQIAISKRWDAVAEKIGLRLSGWTGENSASLFAGDQMQVYVPLRQSGPSQVSLLRRFEIAFGLQEGELDHTATAQEE